MQDELGADLMRLPFDHASTCSCFAEHDHAAVVLVLNADAKPSSSMKHEAPAGDVSCREGEVCFLFMLECAHICPVK